MPVTFTSAAVSSISSLGQAAAGGAQFGLVVTLPAADVPALTAVATTAYDAQGDLDLSVDGRIWVLARVTQPFTSAHFEIPASSKNQALQFQRILVPAS